MPLKQRPLCYILSALSQTLARIPEIRAKTQNLPRMAYYALFAKLARRLTTIASEQASQLDGESKNVEYKINIPKWEEWMISTSLSLGMD
jgi:hypothetical protein